MTEREKHLLKRIYKLESKERERQALEYKVRLWDAIHRYVRSFGGMTTPVDPNGAMNAVTEVERIVHGGWVP